MNNKEKPYRIIGKEICFCNDSGGYVAFAKALKIIKVIRVTDDDDTAIQIKIAFIDFFDTSRTIIITPSSLSNKIILLKLSDKGLDINDDNVKLIQEYLYYSLNEERDYQIINMHAKLGFERIKDKLIFKHFNLIVEDEVNEGIEQSTYNGLVDLKPKGTYEEYCEFLKEVVVDSPTIQLALALSLTAPILWLVSEFDVEIESMVINLAGKSSSGKSTMLMLMTSLWGECQVTSNHSSLIKNWNSTSNALLKEISRDGYQGIPIALDEVGMANIKDFSKFIYTVSSGMDKKRLTSTSQLMDVGTFKTCVISSGELTIRDNVRDKAVGSTLIRLIELNQVQWTKTADESNKIKAFVTKNHGTFAPEFIKLLLGNVDTIIENWQASVEEIKDRVKDKVGASFCDRLSMKFALILVAYNVMMCLLDLEDINDDETILELLLDSLAGQELESDLSRKAYDCIMNELVENNNSYIKFKDPRYTQKDSSNIEPSSSRVYGKCCNKEYVITRERFEKVLLKNGFKDIKGILFDWQDKNIIVSEQTAKDRRNPFNRRIIVGQTKVPVVVIRKNNIYEDEDDIIVNEYEEAIVEEDMNECLFEEDFDE